MSSTALAQALGRSVIGQWLTAVCAYSSLRIHLRPSFVNIAKRSIMVAVAACVCLNLPCSTAVSMVHSNCREGACPPHFQFLSESSIFGYQLLRLLHRAPSLSEIFPFCEHLTRLFAYPRREVQINSFCPCAATIANCSRRYCCELSSLYPRPNHEEANQQES